jgi:amino acid transporter
MSDTSLQNEGPTSGASPSLGIRQAAFIGVGSMVGAGIFSLLGAAGAVAGAAVWISFLLAGLVAGLQGYSFAKFGGRFPSAGGLLEYVRRGYGDGHTTGITAWLVLATNAIVTAMVAISFGSYASSALTDSNATWIKIFAVLLICVMSLLNVLGSKAVANAQTVVVVVVIGSLTVFAVSTLTNLHPHLLAPSGYPSAKDIISSVALTFFAFLGFGVITFTAKDLPNPRRQLPRAMFLALGIATVIYVAVSIGVFGTLTVEKVIDSGGTALAVAAQPVLGRAGYWLMTVTALFATSGLGGRAPMGLLLTAVIAIVLAAGFDLDAVASIGSAVALVVFTLISIGHLRVRGETGAQAWLLILAVCATTIVFVTFAVTTLVHEPATLVVIAVIVVVSLIVDFWWKSARASPSLRS